MSNKIKDNSSGSDSQLLIYDKTIEKAHQFEGARNIFYYFMLVLLNLCIMGVITVIVYSVYKVEKLSVVFSGVDWRYLYLMISIVAVILLLRVFSDYMMLYSRSKQRRFGRLVNANIKHEFYSLVTMYSLGRISIFANELTRSGVGKRLAVDIAYAKKFLSKIAWSVYFIIALLIGSIFVFEEKFIVLFMASLIALFVSCIILIFIIVFGKNKESAVAFVGKLGKILYKFRIVKDYEKFYKNAIEKIIVCRVALKSNKFVVAVQIVSSFIICFLRHFLIFGILKVLNIAEGFDLIAVIYNASMMDLIVSLFPLRRGALYYNLLFVTLFAQIFSIDLIVPAMIMVAIFDYLIYVLLFVVVKIVDKIVYKIDKKSNNNAIN